MFARSVLRRCIPAVFAIALGGGGGGCTPDDGPVASGETAIICHDRPFRVLGPYWATSVAAIPRGDRLVVVGHPDLTLPYVAATLRKSIDAYNAFAGFDISANPGITATLYNVGNPVERARALRRENAERVANGEEPRLPEENYYGWLVNDRLAELQALF